VTIIASGVAILLRPALEHDLKLPIVGGGVVGGDGPRDDAWAASYHVHRLEFELHNARDVDAVARGVISHLLDLPDVSRVGLALVEGAGRRLRFVASDGVEAHHSLDWCHIDAYDDVPLTAVARSGVPVIGSLDQLEPRFPGLVAHQREQGTRAIATVPLPGNGAPMGAIILFFDSGQRFGETELRMFEAAARRTADAVRRVRADALGTGPTGGGPALGHEGHRAVLDLDSDPRSAGLARRFLGERLDEWGVPADVVDTAQLCLSELVNNVIMHAQASSELTLHLEGDELNVILRDRGGAQPFAAPRARPAPVMDDDEDELIVSGRGLVLVDALTDRWGTERSAVGTTAWFSLDLHARTAGKGSEQTG
jgi:anti-sigma regulatory factor (Ser/Thr protein kinase)